MSFFLSGLNLQSKEKTHRTQICLSREESGDREQLQLQSTHPTLLFFLLAYRAVPGYMGWVRLRLDEKRDMRSYSKNVIFRAELATIGASLFLSGYTVFLSHVPPTISRRTLVQSASQAECGQTVL